MRLLFAGSPELAVPSLEALTRRHEVRGVLTNPDRPCGRGRTLDATPVKRRALELGLEVLQPGSRGPALHKAVRSLGAELLVVIAFGTILEREFLELFPLGGINLHASLLPKYRGPSPITAVILAGERETGLTVQRLTARMDAGDILAVRRVELTGRETTGSLSERLCRLAPELLLETLDKLAAGTLAPLPQEESAATYCRLVRKEDGRVDWRLPAATIERMIRAYDPWPRAWTTFQGRRLALLSGGVHPEGQQSAGKPGGLVLGADSRYGILVSTGGGVLYADALQLQGRNPLDWRSFLNGHRDLVGATLGGET
ncbi:MAG: methionyl-tRNA formyltransferase [Spirochaetales bacterium]|nr:methionyl-tRNA formyltransferase [Spirochaetales bacterium]